MADTLITIDSDVAKLIRDQQRVIAKQDEQITKFRQMGTQARRAGDTGSKAATDVARHARSVTESLTGLTLTATGLITAAGAAAVQAIRSARQEAEAAGEAVKQSESGLAQLAQLSVTDPSLFADLTKSSRELFRAGAAPSLDAAARLAFRLSSAGALGEQELFGDIAASKLVGDNTAELAEAADSIRTAFGSKAGSFRDVISQSFGVSPIAQASAEQIAVNSAKAGGTAAALGFSPAELLAATAVASKVGGAAEAGTQVASFMTALAKDTSLVKPTLADTVRQFEGKSPGELFELLGRAEAVRGVQTLSENLTLFEKTTASAAKAVEDDLIGRLIETTGADPAVAAGRASRGASARAQLASEQIGIAEAIGDAMVDARIAAIREDPNIGALDKHVRIIAERFDAFMSRALFGPDTILPGGINAVPSPIDSEARAMMQAAQEMQGAAREWKAAAPGSSMVPAARAAASTPQE